MCARTCYQGKVYRPGNLLIVKSSTKDGQAKWAGFARSETVESVWGKTHTVDLDVPADKFAENNKVAAAKSGAQVLTWAAMPPDAVIYGIGNRKNGEVKLLTRQATDEERQFFGHHRLPVIGPRRF